MKTFIKIIHSIAWILIGLGLFVSLYIIGVFSLSHIVVPKQTGQPDEVSIYIITNGDHTDVVVPVKNEVKDWGREIKYANTLSHDTTPTLLALGWGDKGFYLNTPTWAQLKFSVSFKAATGLSTAAMHATFYRSLKEGKDCVCIGISRDQYSKLVTYIDQSFQKDAAGHYQYIQTTAQYGKDDAFYDAKRRYNIFYTCNTWANNALKSAGQKACFWTPLDKGIFDLYK